MPSVAWKRLSATEDYELHAPDSSHGNLSSDHLTRLRRRSVESADDYRRKSHDYHAQGVSAKDFSSLKQSLPPRPSLGKPTAKKTFHMVHLLAAATSLTASSWPSLPWPTSWRLGTKNYQLIVLGFLLGIMNLCLGSVIPMFFLLLEARFGPSTLQNYNGILRKEVFGSRLSWFWRIMLSLVLALPLGLSVAYKTFTGGESVETVDVATFIGNTSYLDMFAPPGLQVLGQRTGISLFSNATLPFAVAAADQVPLPTLQQPYGFNMLLLNNESAAALDIPQPDYVSAVQALLAGGESWNYSSPVLATVATYNHSRSRDPELFEADFKEICDAARASSGAYTNMTMMNEWIMVLVNRPSPGDQTM
ncbi:MAG: hypothetical protein Q9192_008710, partial [Flavoplaca navasiana]